MLGVPIIDAITFPILKIERRLDTRLRFLFSENARGRTLMLVIFAAELDLVEQSFPTQALLGGAPPKLPLRFLRQDGQCCSRGTKTLDGR